MAGGNNRKSFLSRRAFIRLGVLSAPALCLMDGFWMEPSFVKLERIRLSSSPALRIIHFSDLHYKGDKKLLSNVVGTINSQKPDFACFTGDIIEEASFLADALEILGKIECPLYGVPGNHEYWAGAPFEEIEEVFRKTGGRWLADSCAATHEGKVVVHGSTGTDAVNSPFEEGRRNILLAHYPAAADRQNRKFDVILSGHSHGGQVRIPFLGPLVLPDKVGNYSLGLYQTPGGPLYVNPGIGTWLIPARFNCRPEITLVEI